MPATKSSLEENVHEHLFRSWVDPSSLRCLCGATQISEMEFVRRAKAWQEYYSAVQETPSAQRFQAIRLAWSERNMAEVSKLAAEAGKALEEKSVFNPPNFPDPSDYNYVLSDSEQPF